jgi:hypothetical protein
LISQQQSGFRKQRSTLDSLTFIHDKASISIRNKGQLLIFFADITQAYDEVDRTQIIQACIEKGICGNMIKFISNFLIRACNGKYMSDTKKMENGIPQGAVISCTLFPIAMDKITESLDNNVGYCCCADDLAIMASGKLKFCKKAMQDNINALNKSLGEFGLNLSEEKSKLMVFSNKHRRDQPNISLNGVAIQYVDAHKYLGVIFDRKLQFKEDIANTKAKAMKSLRVLKMVKNSHYSIG